MQPRTLLALPAALSFLSVSIWAAPAGALTFEVVGQNLPTEVSADVELSYDGADTLTVEITNTSVIVAAATGFAFNVPDAVTGISSFSAVGTGNDTDWAPFFPTGSAPGGYIFEAGAGSGPNLNGGKVASGFDMGDTATFSFVFSGDALALAALTENDFVGEPSAGAGGPADFGVRFQGIAPEMMGGEERSDFALHNVPAPGATLLLALGLLGMRPGRR